MPNSRTTSTGVIELIEGYDMTCVYWWHRPHLWAWQARGGFVKWKPSGTLFRIFSDVVKKSEVGAWVWGTQKKNSFLFLAVSKHSSVAPPRYFFSSLCQNYFWLERESVYSAAWFARVTPCSRRANPLFSLQNGLHIFLVTQDLKKTRETERRVEAIAIISGFTCSQLPTFTI